VAKGILYRDVGRHQPLRVGWRLDQICKSVLNRLVCTTNRCKGSKFLRYDGYDVPRLQVSLRYRILFCFADGGNNERNSAETAVEAVQREEYESTERKENAGGRTPFGTNTTSSGSALTYCAIWERAAQAQQSRVNSAIPLACKCRVNSGDSDTVVELVKHLICKDSEQCVRRP
jgi:hypothetical protein